MNCKNENCKLKACPFCGGGAFVSHETDNDGFGVFYSVKCRQCLAETAPRFASRGNDCQQFYAEVRELWNTRAEVKGSSAPSAEPAEWKGLTKDQLDELRNTHGFKGDLEEAGELIADMLRENNTRAAATQGAPTPQASGELEAAFQRGKRTGYIDGYRAASIDCAQGAPTPAQPAPVSLNDAQITAIAGQWFVTGENQHREDGYYYRSQGTPTNVRGSDLIGFARAVIGWAVAAPDILKAANTIRAAGIQPTPEQRPLGCSLAMRVMQSDLYPKLDEAERSDCDLLVLQNIAWFKNDAAASIQPAPAQIYEQRLRSVLHVAQRYLPPDDGIDAKTALGEIVGLVDPWPGEMKENDRG